MIPQPYLVSVEKQARYPSISVILCTYNRDHGLLDSLSSVLAQDYAGEWEVIVVDQTKTHSQEAAGFLDANSGRIHRLLQEEANLPRARNAGFQKARGELVVFLDDDMILPEDTLRRFAGCFEPIRAQAVAGLAISESSPEESLRFYAKRYGAGVYRVPGELLSGSCYIPSPLCLPARTFQRVGGYDARLGRLTPTAYGEDDDFAYRLFQAHVPLLIQTSIRVRHLDHLNGGCGSRQLDPREARGYHIMSMAYRALKYRGRVGLRGWVSIIRGFVVNRESLGDGWQSVCDRFALARRSVGDARSAWIRDNHAPRWIVATRELNDAFHPHDPCES